MQAAGRFGKYKNKRLEDKNSNFNGEGTYEGFALYFKKT